MNRFNSLVFSWMSDECSYHIYSLVGGTNDWQLEDIAYSANEFLSEDDRLIINFPLEFDRSFLESNLENFTTEWAKDGEGVEIGSFVVYRKSEVSG